MFLFNYSYVLRVQLPLLSVDFVFLGKSLGICFLNLFFANYYPHSLANVKEKNHINYR